MDKENTGYTYQVYKDACVYRASGVICGKHEGCEVCGWNPEVEQSRKDKLAKKVLDKPKKKRKSPVKKDTPKESFDTHTDDEVLTIVRFAHRDFGFGTMTAQEIASEYHIRAARVGKARREILAELAQTARALKEMEGTESA